MTIGYERNNIYISRDIFLSNEGTPNPLAVAPLNVLGKRTGILQEGDVEVTSSSRLRELINEFRLEFGLSHQMGFIGCD